MPELTTAQELGKYRAELLNAKIPADVADDLVRIAAREITENEGLRVSA